MCSIRGTNNCHIEFMFSVKYKFAHLQLFDIKFLFSARKIFCKKKRTAVYARTTLVSYFKLAQENEDLLSSRHSYIFEIPHSVNEYIKLRIPKKKYQTNTVRTFWGTWSTLDSRYLGVDHFSRYCTKIYEKQEKLYGKYF